MFWGLEMHDDFDFAIQLTITGLVVVFFALITVALIVWIFQKIDQPEKAATPAKPAPAKKPAAASEKKAPAAGKAEKAGKDGELSPDVLAAILAAATIATRKKVRITRVQYRAGPSDPSWSRQGRADIMLSHTPKR